MSVSNSFQDQFERERLHFAAQDGDVEEVVRLLAAGFGPNEFDDLGKTPLHYAAERGHLDVMKLLLSSGADVNAHDERVIGNTPLREVADACGLRLRRFLWTQVQIPPLPAGCN